VCLGCVVRVESIGQDPTTSLWGKSCQRGAVEARSVGYPLEKISCLVPLRTGMS
jgi:hypothetical protein